MHDVDAEGEIDLDAAPPGTGRVLGVWKAERCAKLAFSADSPLTIANMAAWIKGHIWLQDVMVLQVCTLFGV